MKPLSCGLLLYRRRARGAEVLLVHPGGPFWRHRDAGAWSIPKGEPERGELGEDPDDPAALLAVARREVEEELGLRPAGPFERLSPVRQKGGKVVHAWAVEQDGEVTAIHCNHFEIEWPPRSGRRRSFPEIDQAVFFPLAVARDKINPAQLPWLDALLTRVG